MSIETGKNEEPLTVSNMPGLPVSDWTWAHYDISRPGVYWFTIATVAETAQKWRYRALIFPDEYADGIPDELHDLKSATEPPRRPEVVGLYLKKSFFIFSLQLSFVPLRPKFN